MKPLPAQLMWWPMLDLIGSRMLSDHKVSRKLYWRRRRKLPISKTSRIGKLKHLNHRKHINSEWKANQTSNNTKKRNKDAWPTIHVLKADKHLRSQKKTWSSRKKKPLIKRDARVKNKLNKEPSERIHLTQEKNEPAALLKYLGAVEHQQMPDNALKSRSR